MPHTDTTMPQRPELPPGYSVEDHSAGSDDRPYHPRLNGALIEEFVEREGGSYWAERSEAVAACWSHWREHGPKQWVEYLGSLEARAPFTGFADINDEQRAIAQDMVDRYGELLTINGKGPDVDTVITGSHLMQFCQHALDEGGFSPSKKARNLALALFGAKNVGSELCSLMLAGLVMRLYSAPYGSLNEAGLDFVNTLLVVRDAAISASKPRKLKHPGG